MVSPMSCPVACGPSGGSYAARSCLKKRQEKTKHILTNVLSTVFLLCFVGFSRVPVASASIFPYEDMELQVSVLRRGAGPGDLRSTSLVSPCFR